jgi:hypothetical protein
MVSNRDLPPPHLPRNTLSVGGGGGVVEPERSLKGLLFIKLGQKYQHGCVCISYHNSALHLVFCITRYMDFTET